MPQCLICVHVAGLPVEMCIHLCYNLVAAVMVYALCLLVYHSALYFTSAYQVNDTLKCSVTKVAISFQCVLENLLSGFISIKSFPILLNFLRSKLLKNKSEGILLKAFRKGYFDGDQISLITSGPTISS